MDISHMFDRIRDWSSMHSVDYETRHSSSPLPSAQGGDESVYLFVPIHNRGRLSASRQLLIDVLGPPRSTPNAVAMRDLIESEGSI